MRLIFLLLVLANLLFFAWGQIPDGATTGREPQRLAAQIQPEKIMVAPPRATDEAVQDCRRLVGLTPPVAEQLQQAVAEEDGLTASLTTVPATMRYWVHIPALSSQTAADRRVNELRQLGVTDFQVMQTDGPAGLTISLGIYSTEEAAATLKQTLADKGVKSVRIETRTETPARVSVELRGNANLLARSLPALAGAAAALAEACR